MESTPTVLFTGAALFLYIFWRCLIRMPSILPRSVAVVVLGDVGRSPRMMYHARSFALKGFETSVIGYFESKMPDAILNMPHPPKTVPLSSLPRAWARGPFLFRAPMKVLWQITSLFYGLASHHSYSPEFIIVQNPPSIPTLAVVQLFSYLSGAKVVIDWHNLGYSVLALKLSERHPLVRVARWFERVFGRHAYAHLFVTEAMRSFLEQNWKLTGLKAVLYDRPPPHFRSLTAKEEHELFVQLSPDLRELDSFLPISDGSITTAFTSKQMQESHWSVGLRHDRPALVVSSTSWTPDEDFSVLLDAMSLYDRSAKRTNLATSDRNLRLPKTLVMVTGKGDLKNRYMQEIAQRQSEEDWQYVRCISMWLTAENYPKLLGSADLGVSLHASSSALDLPMKVVDMFGCGLPVCALNFACLGELVKDGVNGLVFDDAHGLALHLEATLKGFPNSEPLRTLRKSLDKGKPEESQPRNNPQKKWVSWDENWAEVVGGIIQSPAR